MKVLVTAGNTWAPIDKVRVITNIFTGRTGTTIALEANQRGHAVTLLTSHSELVDDRPENNHWKCVSYRTFDNLDDLLTKHVTEGAFDAIIHSAAVSDYLSAGAYSAGATFDAKSNQWKETPAFAPRTGGKIKSADEELWLRLVRAPKLVDKIRSNWHFRGILVKFKLEVSVDDQTLLEVAERSRLQSNADLMVANTYEGGGSWAYLGPVGTGYQRISRRDLAKRLLDAVELLHKEPPHA